MSVPVAPGDSRSPERGGHAYLDLPSRQTKARKIEQLLGLRGRVGALRLLEIGVGSGGIADYFATHPTLEVEVVGVDVEDVRVAPGTFEFHLVEDTCLPFPDASFEIIITNHVIEHVGDRGAQEQHLREIARLLTPGGVGYLAVPNRWMLVEPHYRLPFLSWLPRGWRTGYVRLAGRGEQYDCEPLTLGQVRRLLRDGRLDSTDVTIDALHLFARSDPSASRAAQLMGRLPRPVLNLFRRLIPTHVYLLHGPADEAAPVRT